jgi:hypothetical protein
VYLPVSLPDRLKTICLAPEAPEQAARVTAKTTAIAAAKIFFFK